MVWKVVYGLMNKITKTNTKKKTLQKVRDCYFFRAVYHSKNYVIPHSVIASISGRHLEYFKTQKKTTTCQSNSPKTTIVENYRKIVINCDQVEFCFKIAAILDTILNI